MAEAGELQIGLVGPCASGKTAVAARLQAKGYRARALAQEHSYAPRMWQLLAQPSFLVYLECRPDTMNRRQGRTDWTEELLAEQHERLRHARQHADLVIETDMLTLSQVIARIEFAFAQRI